MDNKKLLKVAQSFCCENCDYFTCKKSSFDKHNLTVKHKKATNGNIMVTNGNQKLQKVAQYPCICGKIYNYRSGLCRHKYSCKGIENIIVKNELEKLEEICDKDLIVMLIKQSSEMLEVIKNGTHNTNNSHNNHSNNKTFNLQFFLNETCKNAMNIMDFVDSIQLQLSDLENVGKLGYVEGISNIITSNLKALDVTQRPVHCTDKKREVLYVKDEDKWEKEDEDKIKLRKMIKRVASKNQRLLPKFKEIYPDCKKSSSPFSDQFNKILIESMGGTGDNDLEKEVKIIKNIAKNVTIDKGLEIE
jgi:hypothetical protein